MDSDNKPTKNQNYLSVYLLLGLTLIFGLGFLSILFNFPVLSAADRQLLIIILAGAFGGLLYSIQNRKLERPYIKGEVIYVGTIADCLIGIGGALVVFLVLPGGEENLSSIKLLATAMIGGYGGRSLLDQAVDGLLKKQEELEEQLKQNQTQIKEVQDQTKLDADTLKLLSRYLDTSLDLTEQGKQELLDNIPKISETARTTIFEKTQSAFYKIAMAEGKIQDQPLDIMIVENALRIFKELSKTNATQSNDRYPAHVAYACMTLGRWNDSIQELEEAKKRLRKDINKGNNDQDTVIYESNQALCELIKQGETEEKYPDLAILKDRLIEIRPTLKASGFYDQQFDNFYKLLFATIYFKSPDKALKAE